MFFKDNFSYFPLAATASKSQTDLPSGSKAKSTAKCTKGNIVILKKLNKSSCNLIMCNNICIQCLSLIFIGKNPLINIITLFIPLLYFNSNVHYSLFQIRQRGCALIKSAIPRASLKRTTNRRK